MKVATILGTRPEIIRLSRVIAALDRHMEHVLIHTGQNYDYELNQVFFEDLEIRQPDFFLEAAGQTSAETIGLVISKSSDVLAKVKPDAVLILGDTDASTNVFRRRSIGRLSTISATSICHTATSPANIFYVRAWRRIGSSRPEVPCTRCWHTIAGRLIAPMLWIDLV